MTPIITIQIVARALLWIFVFSSEIIGGDLMDGVPQTHFYYLALLGVEAVLFLLTFWLGNDALVSDIGDLCFYGILVQLVGLFLHFNWYCPPLYIALSNAIFVLKVGRLLWPAQNGDGTALIAWPIFGPVGYWRARTLQLSQGADSDLSKVQTISVFTFILLCMPLTYSLHMAGLKMGLSFWAPVAFFLVLVLYKRVIPFLKTQYEKQIELERSIASAEATAAAKTALADSAAALAAANAELMAVNLQREQMLADIQAKNAALRDAAHDLMQPVMKIQAQIVEAVSTRDDGARAALGDALQARVSDYARSINDTIYAAKITTQALVPKVMPHPLARLRSETAGELLDLAEAHDCELVVRASVRYPDYQVLADEDILARILANLVGNAIRHSGSKWVLVTMRKRAGQCMVAVRDQGHGIDCAAGDDHIANFAAFAERIKTRTRNGFAGGGHGIGINNVKQLCAGLGSQMRLFSRPGSGSVFYFMLPLA